MILYTHVLFSRSYLYYIAVCFLTITINAHNPLLKTLAPLYIGLPIACSALYTEDLAQSKIVNASAQLMAMHPRDLMKTITYASLCSLIAYMVKNKNIKKFFMCGASIPPLLGLAIPNKVWDIVGKSLITKLYYKPLSSIQYIPLIGTYFSCPEKNCPGICHACKIQRLYEALPLAALIMYGTKYAHRKFCPTEFERSALALPDSTEQCCICLENYWIPIENYLIPNESKTKPIPIRMQPCKHHLCTDCAKESFFKESNQQCPVCKKSVDIEALQATLFE